MTATDLCPPPSVLRLLDVAALTRGTLTFDDLVSAWPPEDLPDVVPAFTAALRDGFLEPVIERRAAVDTLAPRRWRLTTAGSAARVLGDCLVAA